MESAQEFPNRGSDQRRGAARWPVLAQMPDVTNDLPASERTRQTVSGRTAGYRIDPPERGATKTGGEDAPARVSKATNALSPFERTYTSSQKLQPHVFERGQRASIWSKVHTASSPVLPAADPFSIPRTRLVDTLSPTVRFITLVVLFTAAGIWIQMISRNDRPTDPPAAPAATAGQPVFELHPIEQSMSKPSASGPLGVTTPTINTADQPEASSQICRSAGPAQARSTSGGALQNVFAVPTLASANGGPLPRVQVSELEFGAGGRFVDISGAGSDIPSSEIADGRPVRLPAVAQSPEQPFDDTSRQANHDKHESSLH